jgi:leader peptidase (prepilin peptidase)/N-methyltransferase
VTADVLAPLAVGLLGLVIGSFLNVCIYRIPRNLSIVSPPSRCTGCGHLLSWYENVPVVSYFVLRGKCRSCGAPFSAMYPLVELTTAAVFEAGYWWYGATPLLAVRLLFACAMIVLFVIDLQHKILPNEITLPGVVVGLVLSGITGQPGWISSLIGIAVGAGTLFAIAEAYYRVRGEEGLGMGDVKMLAMIGAFLGWKMVLLTLVLSSISGSIVGVAILLVKKESLKYALPFGTFLAIGALISAVAGDALLVWYFGFYS